MLVLLILNVCSVDFFDASCFYFLAFISTLPAACHTNTHIPVSWPCRIRFRNQVTLRVVVVKGTGGAFDLLHALTERVDAVGVDTSGGSGLGHSASAVIAILVDAVGGGAAIGIVGITSGRGRACGCCYWDTCKDTR